MTEEEYNQRKAAFETHKNTLEKEPSGSDVKKEYWVGCYSKDDWEIIHSLLLEDGTLEDNIPNDHVDCPNDCRQSETRAVYLLTDTEVAALKNHELVRYVHINTAKYPGTYASNPDDIKMDGRTFRYSSTTKHKRDTSTNQSDYLPSSPDATLLNRGGYNLLRHTEKKDPWRAGLSSSFTSAGTYSWTAPAGIATVSVVCVGGGGAGDGTGWSSGGAGGGLAWKNNISVTPGQSYVVQVGSGGTRGGAAPDGANGGTSFFISTSIVAASGGYGHYNSTPQNPPGGEMLAGDGGGSGGLGGYYSGSYAGYYGGGGGAGGYAGTGGNGGTNVPTHPIQVSAGTGGAGGGGWAVQGAVQSSSGTGGGVGIYGQGVSGAAGTSTSSSTWGGRGGSGGEDGGSTGSDGADYGAGAGGGGSIGGGGAVRIVWGEGRQFPSQNVQEVVSDATILDSKIPQYATGKGIDLIVCDEDMWFGHIEFMNPSGITDIKQSDNSTAASTVAPANYVGTNVLKSGFSTSSTTGICELLDLVLDAPYYIDKEWFEADAGNRLMTRWDGTKVPVESVARSWWSNSSNRSAAFSSAGTVSVPAAYTRANSNGSYTAYHTGSGNHGTPCASQAYGRQYGWAYNANKWFLNLYGTNSVGLEAGFDLQKIFHQNKPVNPEYGNKNPTVSSNSWGLRQSPTTSGYYYFRQGVTGGTGTSYSSLPAFMNYFTGDGLNRRSPEYVDGHAAITAGDEMIEAGVIFVCSAGNNNQKQVQSNHADFNNYYASGSSVNYANATTNSIYSLMNFTPTYNSLNRRGFPAQIGVDRSTTPYTYKTISIGALDDDHTAGGLERKASYSNMGNSVDCFAAADQTLSASDDNSSPRFNRYDAYYDIGTTQAVESEDKNFSGTSSACPIAAGLIATKLENNRTWTYADVKNWLASDVENTSDAWFYKGTEATTATDTTNWGDYYNLQGAQLKIIYDTPPPVPSSEDSDAKVSVTGSNISFGGNFSII